MLTHNWNNHAICQLTEATKIGKYDVPASYVNVTQMCQAKGKQWGHYAALDSTKAYWQGLSLEVNIPIDRLVIQIMEGKNEQRCTWVHSKIAEHCYSWCSKSKNQQKEKAIQTKLAFQLRGQVEVPHSAGRIDILTKTEIIEVKEINDWVRGVGQLVVYGQSYPSHQKRLHLFGKLTRNNLSLVKQYCTPLNISVTAENATDRTNSILA